MRIAGILILLVAVPIGVLGVSMWGGSTSIGGAILGAGVRWALVVAIVGGFLTVFNFVNKIEEQRTRKRGTGREDRAGPFRRE
jgi:TRAP-type C4-dicarboxylate transport system permease small subunit